MLIAQKFSIDYQYNIQFTKNLFSIKNNLLGDLLCGQSKNGRSVRVAFVVDGGLSKRQPNLIPNIVEYIYHLDGIEMLDKPLIVKGGEVAKNSSDEMESVLKLINHSKIDRHSFLIAIGGGAVLDMAGFASAIAHRGLKHIRIPTTVLSQNDSGVGVKNGINYFGKKNFVGAFAPPFAVINDLNFLETLNDRDWRSGMSEAVKVALIKDREFFDWLAENAKALGNRDLELMDKLIFRCAELHSDHISNSNDPFELGSSRPLDFGHWAAHKLEQLTNFNIKHGEAVAIGIVLDIFYGNFAGFMKLETCEKIVQVFEDLGFEIFHPALLNEEGDGINEELIRGLEEFREHLGGELTITMVEKIGEKFDVHEMYGVWIEKSAMLLKSRAHAN